MSGEYLAGLGLVVSVLLGARVVLASMPLHGLARSVTWSDAVVGVAGVLGLVVHCEAMFVPTAIGVFPGSGAAIRQINAMGTGSVTWYVVAALLVLAGLRHQVGFALALVGLALVAVGVTMYDGGSLPVHLLAIFLSVTILSGVVAFLAQPP